MVRAASAIFLAWVTMVIVATLLPGVAFAQIAIKTQAPCLTAGDSSCVSFVWNDTIPTIRTFSFSIPKPGTLLVSFHGSMTCSMTVKVTTDSVVDLVSAILTSSSQRPSLSSPGSLRLAEVLKDLPDNDLPTSVSFNLTSERVIQSLSGGTKTVYFKIASQRMDVFTGCKVYGATFSVVYLPAP